MASFTATSPILTCVPSALRTFLGRPANLPQISNPDLELEIVKAPLEVVAGERIEFRITAYGFKQRATHEYLTTSEILILESQIDGPLRAWQHAQKIEIVTPDATHKGQRQLRLANGFRSSTPAAIVVAILVSYRFNGS